MTLYGRSLLEPALGRRGANVASIVIWCVILALVTTVVRIARGGEESQAHVVLIFLLVVLGGSVSGGRPFGLLLAAVSSLLINFMFQPPLFSFVIARSVDGVVLAAFLATAYVTTHLLARERAEAERARAHAREIERLSDEARHTEALREAARLKDVVLASVSHDLRTPLTTIKALAQDSAASGDANAAIIVSQAERLGDMVAALLDLSRLNAGAFPVTLELNTVEDLVGASVHQVSGVHDVERVHIDIDYTRPALLGTFDFVHSLRIVTNLLDNALRYSPDGSTVSLTATQAGEWLELRVVDCGPGIPAEDAERIFEPFYRHPSTARTIKGTGLGLAIARRLAETQGGTVTHANRDGGGSVFTLRLHAVNT
ncbi:MAG TPA: ATP-binding protein [Candidatus Elarobacter sp.]|nr:ATP-binding protein [Candidatus Elarobacter sp.]